MTLKDKVEELSKERGISVREVERRAGLKERVIQHWDKSIPNGISLYKVATVLDVPIEELLSVYDSEWERIAYVLKLQEENDRLKKEIKKIPATTEGDGQLGNLELAVSKADDRTRDLIQRILNFSPDQISAFLSITQSSQDDQ